MEKKNVVIIGGGGAGSKIASALSSQLDPKSHSVTLIEERDYYLHYPGTLRMMVTSKGSLENTTLIPFDKLFQPGKGRIIHDAVSSITRSSSGTGGTIHTKNSGAYTYDTLVLATGSKYEGFLDLPKSKSEVLRHMGDWREKFRKAQSIAIVGGGPVGCELAGEIRDEYPEKKITIIHRGNHLLHDVYPEKFRIDVDNGWLKRNITLILNDSVDSIPAEPVVNGITTRKGVHVDADLVVPCRGQSPNTAPFESLGLILAPNKRIKVNSNLQVEGLPGVFAAGDIADVQEVKKISKFFGHTKSITRNIKDFMADKPLSSFYKPMFEVLLLSNGANGGAGYADVLWGLRFGDGMTARIKSRSLFIPLTRKGLGY